MWIATKFSTNQKQFDFTSSGQGKPTYTSLMVDDEVLINMIELLDPVEDLNDTFQFLICEQCGYIHCQPGNWLSIRQSGQYVLFIPAFKMILDEPVMSEYQPPYFFKTKGALVLSIQEFEKLKEIVPVFKNITNMQFLSGIEATYLYKWDTPHRMFGEFPNFVPLRANHILCSNEFDEPTISKIIIDKLEHLKTIDKVELVPINNTDIPISFFLEVKPTKEWKVLSKSSHGFELLIGDTFKLIGT